MKVFVALAAFVAFAQAITPDQITCSETSVTFAGKQSDFPRYKGGQISLGSCPLDDNFAVVADFAACGLSRAVDGDFVTFAGELISAVPKGVITRKAPVSFGITCSYERKTSKTAASSVKPLLGAITGDLTQTGNTIDLFLNLLNADGDVIASGNNLEVDVGAKVSAEVGGANLAALGLRAYATNCYVTPNADPADKTRWDLLKDSCPSDATFNSMEKGEGQSLSFESFAFTYDTTTSLFLHCDLVACQADAGCGVCAPTKRRRRSVVMPKMMKQVSINYDVRM